MYIFYINVIPHNPLFLLCNNVIVYTVVTSLALRLKSSTAENVVHTHVIQTSCNMQKRRRSNTQSIKHCPLILHKDSI